jgi:site-specific recombinase XerC
MQDLITAQQHAIAVFAREAQDYADHAKSEATKRAYRTDWAHFEAWATEHGFQALPASAGAVGAYLVAHAHSHKLNTLSRRIAAIRSRHHYAGLELDLRGQGFRDLWKGLRKMRAQPLAKKKPVMTADIRKMIEALPEGKLISLRDRAMLLVGLSSALRRSELAALVLGEGKGHRIAFNDDGVTIALAETKTDQLGNAGTVLGLPYGSHSGTCPVRALKDWLTAAGITEGPVFRPVNRHSMVKPGALTGHAIAMVVKRSLYRCLRGEGASHEEATAAAKEVAGHSLRAGFATQAARNNANYESIRRQTRHKRLETLLGYIRETDAFRNNAASFLGL